MNSSSHSVKTTLLTVFLATLLAACGGGGGGGSDGGDDPTAGSPPATNPPSGGNPPPPPSPPQEPVAGSAALSWDIPQRREDGDNLVLAEIGGYEINYRLEGDALFTSVVVNDGTVTEYVIEDLAAGRYEIYIHAFDEEGVYSSPSDSIFASI